LVRLDLRFGSYATGVLLVGIALLLRATLHPWLGTQFPLVTLLLTVGLIAWRYGWKPALLTSAVGFAIASYFFTDPRGPFSSLAVPHVIALIGYAFLCAVIVGFSVGMRQARIDMQHTLQRLRTDSFELRSQLTAGEQLTRELQEGHRRKDEFLATLAHELRNPLAPIRNAIHLLRVVEDRERVQAARDIIDRQSQQLVHLVDELLDLSRIARGTIELRLEPVDVASVVQIAVETTRPLIETRGHALSVKLPERQMIVAADRSRLVQVIANVLNNSAKYSPDGGNIELAASVIDNDACIVIRDDGNGIEQDMIDTVFEMYAQIRTEFRASQEGLGIGLALVKKVIELHGGSVSIESDGAGQGTRVTLRLPLQSAAA
jgi:signal transduction histidine kinase